MKREEFEAYLVSKGWTVDRFGHYHKDDQRFKMQKISVRWERSHISPATQYSPAEKRWFPIRTGY